MSDVQPSKALYYPHAEFGSAAWVKSALLYWEGVVRFVPAVGAPPRDDPELRELADAGLIENLAPGPRGPFWSRATRAFAEQLEELLRSHGEDLLRSMPALRGVRGVAPDLMDEGVESLVHELEALGCPIAARAARAPAAMGLYATAIASVVARERRVAPMTDDPIFDAITTHIDEATITKDARDMVPAEALAAAQLFIPVPSLEAVAPLPVWRLLEIRRKYATQRRAFREKVQAHASAIAQLPSAEAVRDHMRSFANEIEEDVDAAREAMKEAKVKDRWALLGVSASASLNAGISIAGASAPVLGPLGGTGSLALAVTGWLLQKRNAGQDPGRHYLLSLQTSVGAEGHSLSNALRKLAHG